MVAKVKEEPNKVEIRDTPSEEERKKQHAGEQERLDVSAHTHEMQAARRSPIREGNLLPLAEVHRKRSSGGAAASSAAASSSAAAPAEASQKKREASSESEFRDAKRRDAERRLE